jgi:transketolase
MQSRQTPEGIQVHYGIREHAMAASMNGMAQHRGVLPLGGTFFCFSDYMRPAVRLASLTGTHVIYSWTHDSIGLGQDGPTHQPIEHLASLRAMPGLSLVRPADANETAQAWRIAVEADGPVGLVLTRQNVPVLDATAARAPVGVAKGAYVLVDSDGPPRIVLVGSGSEVQLCVAAAATLAEAGVQAQVVSFPSWDHFEQQPEDYRATVFPPGVPVLSVEAGATFGWDRYADDSIGIDRYGASASGDVAMEKFGFTADHVVERARALLGAKGG